MQVLPTRVEPTSEAFVRNREGNLAALDKLHALLARAEAGGGDKYVRRHLDRGKLLPRQRVELLLDRGSPFLELGALAGGIDGGHPGAGVIGGIGRVAGTEVLITASEATVQGGAINAAGVGILMVEQNARQALQIADHGHVLVNGRNFASGTGKDLLADEDVRRSFLGGAAE